MTFAANIQRLKSCEISYSEAKQLRLRGLQLRTSDQKREKIPEELTPAQQKFLEQVEAIDKFDMFDKTESDPSIPTNVKQDVEIFAENAII